MEEQKTLEIKVRPTKIAFLIDPKNKSDLIDFMTLSTYLWGGQYNPIIPIFKRIPNSWKDMGVKGNLNSLTNSYIKNFSPDIFVVKDSLKIDQLGIPEYKIIRYSNFINRIQNGRTEIGSDLTDVVYQFHLDEFKFHSDTSPIVNLYNFDNRNMLLNAVFGNIPDYFLNKKKLIKKLLKAREINISNENYYEHLRLDVLSPRKLTRHYLPKMLKSDYNLSHAIMLLNEEDPSDIINYWNLRANGWNIIPISSKTYEKSLSLLEELLDDEINSGFLYHATRLKIIPGAKISEPVFSQFLELISKWSSKKTMVCSQSWIPRFWDEWAWSHDNIECCEVYSHVVSVDANKNQFGYTFKTQLPPFLNEQNYLNGSHLFANDISHYDYRNDIKKSDVIPFEMNQVTYSPGFRPDQWRVSARGVTYLTDEFIDIKPTYTPPKPEDIFSFWASTNGFDLKISYAGKITERMYDQLDNIYSVRRTIGRSGIIQLLNTITSNGYKSSAFVIRELQKIATQNNFDSKAAYHQLEELVNTKILTAGFEFQCPTCTQRNWYSLTELDYLLTCGKCITEYSTPLNNDNNFKLSYKTIGTFSLPKNAYGCYPTILSYLFFSGNLKLPNTAMFSFELTSKIDKSSQEIDLAMYIKESDYDNSIIKLILVEAKSFNSFSTKDINKMKSLGKKFPGSLLVFATLKEELNKTEKISIRQLVNFNVKRKEENKPHCEILILTNTELLTHERPPYCWNDDIKQKLSSLNKSVYQISSLAAASQEIYLDDTN